MKDKKTNSIYKKIFGWIVNIVFLASIVLLLTAVFFTFKYSENPEDSYLLGYKPVFVMTGSMEPTIKEESIIIVEKVNYDDVKVGDIVMFEKDEKIITHRVIQKDEMGIRTKGDNNNSEDAFLLQEGNIKAKVISAWNWSSTIIKELKTPIGLFKWIGLPVLFCFFIFSATKLVKVLRKKKDS